MANQTTTNKRSTDGIDEGMVQHWAQHLVQHPIQQLMQHGLKTRIGAIFFITG